MENLFRSPVQADSSVASLLESLENGCAAGVAKSIYILFAGICYDDITAMERSAVNVQQKMSFAESILARLGEYFYRAVLLSYLRGAGTGVSQEPHTNFGRADLVVDRYRRAFVIETKMSDTPAGAAVESENGMRQIIGRKYGDSYPDPILMSVAVDLSSRNIGACVILDKGTVTRLRPDGQGGLELFVPGPAPEAL